MNKLQMQQDIHIFPVTRTKWQFFQETSFKFFENFRPVK